MSQSRLFFTDQYKLVQAEIQSFLNDLQELLREAGYSPRAAGDAIQELLADQFAHILGPEWCFNYTPYATRGAMIYLAFEDAQGCHYEVAVKTHRLNKRFSSPNLASVEHLARFYQDDQNFFVVLLVAVDRVGRRVVVKDVVFVPIEFLDWSCLTIGAQGGGQIQIVDSHRLTLRPQYSRQAWMLEFCDRLLEFYPQQIAKIDHRLDHFRRLRDQWAARPE